LNRGGFPNRRSGRQPRRDALGQLSGVQAPWGGSTTRGSIAISGAVSASSPSATICPSCPITLSAHLKDADGLAVPYIAYQPHENDRRMMRFAMARLKDLATAVDAFDHRLHDLFSPEGAYQPPAGRLLGTCRMGRAPKLFHQPLVPVMRRAESLHRRRQPLAIAGVVNPTPPSARWHDAPPSTCATISASCVAPRIAIRVAPIHIGHRQVDETFQTLARFPASNSCAPIPATTLARSKTPRFPGFASKSPSDPTT
jgi:hypothetical protein